MIKGIELPEALSSKAQDNCMLEVLLNCSDSVQQHNPQDNTEYDVATS